MAARLSCTVRFRFSLAALVALLSWHVQARAQSDAALTESVLRAPWEQHLLVLQSMASAITGTTDAQRSVALADGLATLQASLGEYETQVDEVIDRIIGDPQYAYVASETSDALSVRLADVYQQFNTVYAALDIRDRADVRAAQASLEALRKALEGRRAFERDIVQALGSGSRQQIVELATRWWKGEEQAIAVKKLVAEYRQKVEALPGSQPSK